LSEEVFAANYNEDTVIGYNLDDQNWNYLPSDIPNLPPSLKDVAVRN